jgi:hypothetical protein
MKSILIVTSVLFCTICFAGHRPFEAMDLFNMEYALDPQISADGKSVAYVLGQFDKYREGKQDQVP